MASSLVLPPSQKLPSPLAAEITLKKHLNYRHCIPHELYPPPSGNEGARKRRTSGLRLSHTVRASFSLDLDDVLAMKNGSTYDASQTDLDASVARPSRSNLTWIENFIVRFFVEWWLLEIISFFFSAMCMAAIVIVLLSYDEHRIPDWPFGMTINGFISVFSNFAKSALLLSTAEALGQLKWNWFRKDSRTIMDFERIDQAGRGPWGALTLLFRTRGTTLTSLGALVIILSLPLDIFFQQLVAYPQGFLRASDMVGAIPQAMEYNAIDGIFTANGSQRINPSFDMIVQVEPFFHGPGSIPKLNGDCPTNNCTWAPYNTLAVCSQCSTLSEALKWECKEAPADWLSTVTLADVSYPNVTACGYWFKKENKNILMSGYVMNANGSRGEALSTRLFGLSNPDPSSRQPIFGGTLQLSDLRNPIVDFLIAGTPDDVAGVYANKTPALTECAFYWCVNTVQSSNFSGSYSESITNSLPLQVSNKSWPWYAFTDENGLAHNRYMANFSLTLPSLEQSASSGQTFQVDNITMVTTVLAMDEIVPGYVTAPDDLASSQSSLRWINAGGSYGSPPQLIPMAAKDNPWLPPHNVSQHVERLAAAMSVVVRNFQTAGKEMQLAKGAVWKQHTLVKIRWVWVSLPLAVLALGLVFLMGTVVISSRERDEVGIWKTSVIAVLFNGLGDEVQQSVPPNCSMGEAREKANQLKVRLVPD